MRDVIVVVGIAVVAALVAWRIGSLVLRVLGMVLVLAGLAVMFSGGLDGLIAVLLGLAVWVAGHWVYAFRHHDFPSPLAERLFVHTPLRRIDPTRSWGTPVFPIERDRRR